MRRAGDCRRARRNFEAGDMTREPFRVEITEQRNPMRIVVSVQPRNVLFPSAYFVEDEHADAYAATLRDRHGWPIVDRRQSRAA